jgi:hypothetical protein
MKKICFPLLFCFLFESLRAQVTVTGSTTASANTTYFIGTTSDSQVFNSDAGTNIYRDVPFFLNVPVPFIQHRIYRTNGQWILDKVIIGANGPSITSLHSIAGSNNNPPCVWSNNMVLSGQCQSETPATILNPLYLSVPQLTANSISGIIAPQRGMLVFDLTNNCLKVYNGMTWKCLTEQ